MRADWPCIVDRGQAFMVRGVKHESDAKLWATLQAEEPGLLSDVPTEGRSIEWDELDTAEYPLFGSNNVNNLVDLAAAARLDMENAGIDGEAIDLEAQARMERHWEQLRRDERERERRLAMAEKRRNLGPPLLLLLTVALFGVSQLLLSSSPPPNPAHRTFANCPPAGCVPQVPQDPAAVNCTDILADVVNVSHSAWRTYSRCLCAFSALVNSSNASADNSSDFNTSTSLSTDYGNPCVVPAAAVVAVPGFECGTACNILIWWPITQAVLAESLMSLVL